MRLGYWIVDSLDGGDAQDAPHLAHVHSQMNPAMMGTMYLPPYLRPTQCGIVKDSVLFGCIDDVTGKGFAMYGEGDADFQYFFDADVEIKKKLDVVGKITASDDLDVSGDIKSTGGDIEASAGDVKAGSVSLQKHTHTIIPQTGTQTSSADGTIPPI